MILKKVVLSNTTTKYRWINSDGIIQTEWFYNFSEALQWIINHDREKYKNIVWIHNNKNKGASNEIQSNQFNDETN